ncbi:DUF3460 family protein [Uliginosibacterium sp. sgz301328]|uniref:DUF3460 family protein n=1 Tax=Uliginosibacterium sp. sgz301328 TaxID=3243764 RepID=UPI00359E825F
MAMYESEHTKFMREFLDKHPEELTEQRKGRALWWDKPQDVETTKANAQSLVAQKPYVYQTEV